MVAVALRESSVLVLVFGLLDKFVHASGPSAGWTLAVVGLALLCFTLGGTIERKGRA